MAKANKSRFAILGILANSPGSSGYDLQSIMRASTDFFWKETYSSIYPVLDALRKEGLIVELEASSSGRKRKTYKITKDGLKVLERWLMEDVELEQARNELLLKVFLGDLNSLDSNIEHIKTYKKQIRVRMSTLANAKKRLVKEYLGHAGLVFWLMTIEFGLRRMQASLEWSDYALNKLSKLKKSYGE